MADNFLQKLFGNKDTGNLNDVLNKYFVPEIQRQGEQRDKISSAFYGAVGPGSYDAAATAAKGYASQLFAPGGEVAGLIGQARGKSIGSGYQPQEGANRGTNAILRGASGRIADTFAQTAGQLELGRQNSLASAYGADQGGYRDLIESLFTGYGNIGQYNLANKSNKLFGLI